MWRIQTNEIENFSGANTIKCTSSLLNRAESAAVNSLLFVCCFVLEFVIQNHRSTAGSEHSLKPKTGIQTADYESKKKTDELMLT